MLKDLFEIYFDNISKSIKWWSALKEPKNDGEDKRGLGEGVSMEVLGGLKIVVK